MIVTQHFNILLFPKCGTHFIASVFEKTKEHIHTKTGFPVTIDVNHLPASKLPYGANQKPTGIVVRNAWDWYVSRYFYFEHARLTGTAGFFNVNQKTNRNFIVNQWTKNCGFGKTIAGFRKHLPYALEHFPLGDSYFQFIADAPKIYFIRHEALAAELHGFIGTFSMAEFYAYTSTLQVISEQQPVNKTPDRPKTVDCYTNKLIENVFAAESKYIVRFGQEFNYKK